MKAPPPSTQLFEGEIATYWFDEDGILYSLSKSLKRTVENLTENHKLVHSISGGQKRCLLIYLSPSPMPDKDARDFSAEQLPKVYKAMAMVSKSGLGSVIMNVLFKLKKSPIPMKSFSDAEEAKSWLKQYL